MKTRVTKKQIKLFAAVFYCGLSAQAQSLSQEILYQKTVEVSYYANDSDFFDRLSFSGQLECMYTMHNEDRVEKLYDDLRIVTDIQYSYPVGILDSASFYPQHVIVRQDSIEIYDEADSMLFTLLNAVEQSDTNARDTVLGEYIIRSYFVPVSVQNVGVLQQEGYTVRQNDANVQHYSNATHTYLNNARLATSIYRYHPTGVTEYEEYTSYDTLEEGVLYPLFRLTRRVIQAANDSCIEQVQLETYTNFSVVNYSDAPSEPIEVKNILRSDPSKFNDRPYAFQMGNSDRVQLYNVEPEIIAKGTYMLTDLLGNILAPQINFDVTTNQFILDRPLRYGVYLLTPRTQDLPQFKILIFNRN